MLEYREIAMTEPAAKIAAEMVRKYSWGEDYPVDPWDELQKADYVIGCFDGTALVGFGAITHVSSPDEFDNGEPWLADAVVLPAYREQGIYQNLYEKRVAYSRKKRYPLLLVCTDNPIIENFLLGKKWKTRRKTRDESGENCTVFELKL